MPEHLIPPAADEAYGDFIIQYNRNMYGTGEQLQDAAMQILDANLAILYVPLEEAGEMTVNSYSYNSIPKCFTYMDRDALSASGITRLQEQPYLQLRGRRTVVAVIDSGIAYTHPAFLHNGRTRIAAIWDQTRPWEGQEGVPYGAEYGREQIQEAIDSADPQEVVPSQDEEGHGTFLAGIAAGSDLPVSQFSGAAPEAELIIVKLKQAKNYLREFYLLPPDRPVFQENDIMMGIWYAVGKARELGLPLSICIGLGANLGAHRGGAPLSWYMNSVTHYSQNVISVAAGNEGNTRNHFYGVIGEQEQQVAVELRVGEQKPGFVAELWGDSTLFYRLSIQSPTGEILPVSTVRGTGPQTLSFVFVETRIEVSYVAIERESGESLFFMRFLQPAPGIWRLLAGGVQGAQMPFHMWLPAEPFIGADTYFLQPSPYTTITAPGNTREVLTVTAYDDRDGSLFLGASRGYAASGYVKPDLAAPGVEITGPALRGGFTTRSGTSVAAAQVCGAAALFFEWAVVRGNAPFLNGTNLKNYLIRGADRREGLDYPNPSWGYGSLNLYRVFEELL